MNGFDARFASSTALSTTNWHLVSLLGVAALVRPILSVLGVSDGRPWVAVLTTLAITALWIGAVVRAGEPRPVLTLSLAGAVYGAFAICLGIVLQGGLAVPAFALPFVLATNVAWGALAGLAAAGITRLRSTAARA